MKHLAWILILCSQILFAQATDTYQFATTAQQQTFHQLTTELRCLVCQNQNLADSNAPLANDLRNQIATKIQAGQSKQDITNYLIARYGDFILYQPPVQKNTLLLWLAPFILLLVGAFFLIRKITATKSES
jgi:cytochrome c-type biogenesis protein CcmH